MQAKTENEKTQLFPKYVIDEQGYKHYLVQKLGQGGQGAVFKTKDENIVIKVVLDAAGNIVKKPAQYEKFKDEIDEVRILDLPDDIHIAKPVHLLKKPFNGYIMRLLSDMVPIKKLILPAKDEPLDEFYLNTGGLKRRLQLLANTAKILTRIHALPIVYADISPENIFVSKEKDALEVWLIDADNMRYTIDFMKPIYTPGYGAPEVFKGLSSNNTLSDVYSFAILAFEVLALIPPFEGELLLNSGGWDEDSWDDDDDDWGDDESDDVDNYERSEMGDISWIEDEEDDRNFNQNGIPRNIILSTGLRNLFQQTFGLQGRKDPASRPTMKQWYEALSQAADATITCPTCTATFYIGTNTCTFCEGTREPVYLAQLYDEYFLDDTIAELNAEAVKTDQVKLEDEDISKEIKYKKLGFKLIENNRLTTYFYNYHTDDLLLREEIEESIEVSIGRITTIKNLMDKEITVKRGPKSVVLPKYEVYDCPSLEGVFIQFGMNDLKARNISFRLV